MLTRKHTPKIPTESAPPTTPQNETPTRTQNPYAERLHTLAASMRKDRQAVIRIRWYCIDAGLVLFEACEAGFFKGMIAKRDRVARLGKTDMPVDDFYFNVAGIFIGDRTGFPLYGVDENVLAQEVDIVADILDRERPLAVTALPVAQSAASSGGELTVPEAARLHPTVQAIKCYIDEHPGMIGKQIAAAADISEQNFRRLFSKRLSPLGYYNVRGQGYFPPKSM